MNSISVIVLTLPKMMFFVHFSMFLGYDRGLRMGGYCKHRTNGKKGIILGILKDISTVKVQWEADGDISDVSIGFLEYIEPTPFSSLKLTGNSTLFPIKCFE